MLGRHLEIMEHSGAKQTT